MSRFGNYAQLFKTFRIDDSYGFVNVNGNVVIKPQFDFVTSYADVIAARKDGKWCLLDNKGTVLSTQFDIIPLCTGSGIWYSEGLGPVLCGGKFGYINSRGEFDIKPQFDLATTFNNGYASVWTGRSWRFIDKQGQFVTPEYARVSNFFRVKRR